jgi:hypothetical protein
MSAEVKINMFNDAANALKTAGILKNKFQPEFKLLTRQFDYQTQLLAENSFSERHHGGFTAKAA